MNQPVEKTRPVHDWNELEERRKVGKGGREGTYL